MLRESIKVAGPEVTTLIGIYFEVRCFVYFTVSTTKNYSVLFDNNQTNNHTRKPAHFINALVYEFDKQSDKTKN